MLKAIKLIRKATFDLSMQPPKIRAIIEQIQLDPKTVGSSEKLFIFGRNPELSLGELLARYIVLGESPHIHDLTPYGAIVQSSSHLSITQCGAVLKKCAIIGTAPLTLDKVHVESLLTACLENQYLEEKCSYGISIYNPPSPGIGARLHTQLHQIMKYALKAIRIRKAFLIKDPDSLVLNPRKLGRKHVIETGIELVVWYRPQEMVFAITEEVIDIDAFAKRDTGRPRQRPLLQLGLALGRAMINLVSVNTNHHMLPIYDPFCGMGGILSEAYLLGLQAFGSDIDPLCVTHSQENLHWISRQKAHRKALGGFPSENIFPMDVTAPDPAFSKTFTGSIVAETNLLTPLKTYPTPRDANQILQKFELNYRGYLHGIAQILPQRGIGVLVFPQLHTTTHERISLNVERLLSMNGLQICQVRANNVEFPAIFVHSWKEPIIERQIVVFQKK